ncbi:hypothetical protein BDQ12DRAFT_740025 [Crucibulum laeve]|uniref:DUF6534 domain-containing protein n=1 Tax=Crucibulum laeve TaxID=68775 RepID=A0A5C3LEC0_9AGAR|nr:hypothetical protein BDQ12DRAFT_740025 [Crucibulum laeve]
MSSPIPPNIGASSGPLILGYLFNWGLYGILCVQVYLYYISFPRDKILSKALVYGLFLIETMQTIIVANDAFKTFGPGFGDLNALESAHLEWFNVPIVSGIVSATVQIFFARRIYIISKAKHIAIPIVMVALMQGISAIIAGVKAFKAADFSKLQSETFVPTAIWLAGSAVCDVIIAISMIYYLSRRDTGFKRTHTIITRIIRLTVETGSTTATVAVIDVVLFLAFRQNNYHTAPALILGKLYSNTMVLIFNSRVHISGGRSDTQDRSESHYNSYPLSMAARNSSTPRETQAQVQPAGMNVPLDGIKIQDEVWTSDIHVHELKASSFQHFIHSLSN